MNTVRLILVGLISSITSILTLSQQNWLSAYNVIWETPSKDATGQMP